MRSFSLGELLLQKHCVSQLSIRQSEHGNALQRKHTFASSHRKQAH